MPRLECLPAIHLPDGLRVFEARTLRSRVLGLALLRDPGAGTALLIPRCRSVHTLGMRFAIDVAFLDSRGRPVRVVQRVPRRRILFCARAAAVLEAPAGQVNRFLEAAPLSCPRPRVAAT